MKRLRGRPVKTVPSPVNGWEVGRYGSDSRYDVKCLACKTEKKATARSLYNRTLRQCSCSRRTQEELYQKWQSLQTQVNHDPYYLTRGIEIEFGSYEEFKQALPRQVGSQLRRIDPTDNFRPGNITWA